MPDAIQPPQCEHCKRLLRAHFLITRYDVRGAAKGAVRVCSLVCLVQWAANYGTAQGMRGVHMIKDVFAQLTAAFRGGR